MIERNPLDCEKNPSSKGTITNSRKRFEENCSGLCDREEELVHSNPAHTGGHFYVHRNRSSVVEKDLDGDDGYLVTTCVFGFRVHALSSSDVIVIQWSRFLRHDLFGVRSHTVVHVPELGHLHTVRFAPRSYILSA